MSRRIMVFAAVLALAALAAPGTSQAASGGECVVSGGVTLSSPISMTPTSGTFAFTADTTLTCVGVINDVALADSGQVTAPGRYGNGALASIFGPGDTCDHGSGDGTFSANIPRLDGGTLLVTGSFDFIRIGSLIQLDGTANGATLAGVFQFTPDLGQNCFVTPVRSANVTGLATVAG